MLNGELKHSFSPFYAFALFVFCLPFGKFEGHEQIECGYETIHCMIFKKFLIIIVDNYLVYDDSA